MLKSSWEKTNFRHKNLVSGFHNRQRKVTDGCSSLEGDSKKSFTLDTLLEFPIFPFATARDYCKISLLSLKLTFGICILMFLSDAIVVSLKSASYSYADQQITLTAAAGDKNSKRVMWVPIFSL